ncbi:MAG: RcnB family protein [Caulobacterales bacterium]
MKLILSSAVALAMLGAPMAFPVAASAHDHDNNGRGRGHEKHEGRGHDKHHDWRKGDRLPASYRDRYEVVDYRARGFKEPPHGYHYVRDDSGKYLLVGIATGVILGVILANN